MSVTNDFVPFCNSNTGTNLPTQSAYLANPSLPIGNQPGIASSSFVNKALRQGTTIAAVLAQLVANMTQTNVNDNQNSDDYSIPTGLLAQFTAAFAQLWPQITYLTSGSGNFNTTYKFQLVSANATSGATYTNNGVTYTVKNTISGGAVLIASGNGAPTTSGTLTKASGTGDSTITFYAVRAPIAMQVVAVGDGGGGGGAPATTSSQSAAGGGGGGGGVSIKMYDNPSATSTWSYSIGSGGAGGTGSGAGSGGVGTTFGGLTANGGGGGGQGVAVTSTSLNAQNGSGGGASGGDVDLPGQPGTPGITTGATGNMSGVGGSPALGYGAGGYNTVNATGNGTSGSGYGGGGAGANSLGTSASTKTGGSGAAGLIIVTEIYQ